MAIENPFVAIVNGLHLLAPGHQIGFAASCGERLLPGYELFARDEVSVDPTVFRTALDTVWNALDGATPAEDDIERLLLQCQKYIPDTEEFFSDYVSIALDASLTISIALESCIRFDSSHISEIPEFCGDAIASMNLPGEGAMSAVEVASYIDQLHQLPIMHREMNKQLEDLAFLRRVPVLSHDSLVVLRASSQYNILVM